MAVKVKSTSGSTVLRDVYDDIVGDTTKRRYYNVNWSRRIEYTDGPKYDSRGHCIPKWCMHDVVGSASTPVINASLFRPNQPEKVKQWVVYAPASPSTASPPSISQDMWGEVKERLQNEVDLNCNDRVMGYSYLIDLLPMVGAFTRASSTLNRVGRWATRTKRNLRRTPFTTLLKQAASADLINRFVLQTTIQDTKMILDAYDRCVRAFGKASKRNVMTTTLTAQTTERSDGPVQTVRVAHPQNSSYAGVYLDTQTTSYARVQAFCVADIRYNTKDADPVKWIMHSLGIDTPLESLWDKIPFSFVVDYFFRIGDFIDQCGRRAGQDSLRGNIVRVYQCYSQTKCFTGRRYIALNRKYESPTNLRWKDCTFQSAEIGSYKFNRVENMAMLNQLGFWDKGGLWSPHLSSVRNRTLLELGLQIATR